MANCAHTYATGKHSGKHCDIIPASGKYCYKHKKMHAKQDERKHAVDAIVNDPVFSNISTGSKKKLRYSNWYITLNSNQVFENMTTEQKKLFKEFCDYTFSREGIQHFITDTTANDLSAIVKLEISHYYENGGTQGRLHLHALLAVEHTGNLRLQANALRAAAKKILGYTIYFNSNVSTDHAKAYAEYIRKNNSSIKI